MFIFQRHSSRGFRRAVPLDSQAFSAVLGTIFAAIVCGLVMAIVAVPDRAITSAPTANAAGACEAGRA